MSTVAATVSDRAAPPDVTRVWARASATLDAFACLVAFVVTLTGRFFGTRAARAIGTCLCHDRTQRAQCGANAVANCTAPAASAPPSHWRACDFAGLPGQEPCADAVRCASAGASLALFPFAFGIAAEHAGVSRDEPLVPIDRHGGSLMHAITEVDRCKAPASRVETPRFDAGPEYPRPDCLSAEEQLRDLSPPQASSAGCSLSKAEPCAAVDNGVAPTQTVPFVQWPVPPQLAREVAATPLP